ncbi:hypothetical protein LDENG_00175350 [Lucifuga dentata]|nr:hypothetical protein LDENG_00175350 [Lucifuga dentata]
MWRKVSLLFLCCAVCGVHPAADEAPQADTDADLTGHKMPGTGPPQQADRGQDAAGGAKAEESLRGGENRSGNVGAEQLSGEPLQDETENLISQLLADYDKVKIVSSGSDCVCRCIVRPIKRSDCSRIHDDDPASPSQHFYTVETVTMGTDCKQCVCMAPPSAVNPCEGEYRFKKLQEAGKDDIKLSAIVDLLEGSVYGMDLLKLHAITTKLLTRVDNMEKAFARNFTERMREKERVKERVKEKDKEKKTQQKRKKGNDLERQKSGVAASRQKNNEERHAGGQKSRLEQQQPTRDKTGTQQPIKDKTEPKQPIKDKTEPKQPIKEKTEPKQPIKDKNSMLIRGVTFYKAEGSDEEEDEEEERGRGQNTTQTGNASLDILISDQIPPIPPILIPSPGLQATAVPQLYSKDEARRPTQPATTQQPTDSPSTTKQTTTTTKLTTTTIAMTTTTPQPTITNRVTSSTQHTAGTKPGDAGRPIDALPTATESPPIRSRLSWTESPADQPATTKPSALCKDTVASISEPVQQNSYGHTDGAWMRDAHGHGNVIYLTNGHYGNNLLEFRDMDTFKSGQASNSYKLPYSFTGSGHVVFNGAFYYNRAFSRDVIRYELRHRYVAAWTTLHDALLEEQVHRTHTEVVFAVDESGLWLLYPALDTEGFHQEVTLLTQLRPRDLQPIQSFRTGLRRGRYGSSFLVCGVLYAVDSMDCRYANVTYAFDTHTLTHTVPSVAFTNMHGHMSQLSYCLLDRKLYAWDNGHQMNYDIIFAY